MKKRLIAFGTTTALLALTGASFVAAPAQSDGPERHASGSVAGAAYEIIIEKQRRFEVDADLDGVPVRSRWRMVVRHDGERVGSGTAKAVRDDGRWEVDFREIRSENSAGSDTFLVRLQRVDHSATVTRTLSFPR